MQRPKWLIAKGTAPAGKATLREHLQKMFEENRIMKSKIDAAQSTVENRNHWTNADLLGPNAAYSDFVRSRLRSRSRYESLNNSYLKGLVRQLSYDLIGTGPRPQITIPGVDTEDTCAIEQRFTKWARRNRLGRKFRTLHKSAVRCGAGLLLKSSSKNARDPVQFCPRPVEIDLLQTPPDLIGDPFVFDGIRVDAEGEPVEYYFLKSHPGENLSQGVSSFFASTSFETLPADRVIHWYFEDRPQQQHGIPEITPALKLFNHLRRYSDAVLTTAEFAALISGILKTSAPPGVEPAASISDWQMFEVVRGALMAAPSGYEPYQLHPEQPTTTYPEFERTKLNEAGRSCNAPLNVTTGNSSGYNFSSARSDMAPYQGGMWVDRDDFQIIVFEPIFYEWAAEAVQIAGYLPAGLPPIDEWLVGANWDGFPQLDETKSAAAIDTKLRGGQTNLARVCAETEGANWREEADQLAEEVEYFHTKGLKHPYELQAAGQQTATADTVDGETSPPSPPPPARPPQRRPVPSRNGHSRIGGLK